MAVYGKILESRIFSTQQEAVVWATNKKIEFKEAGNPVKADVVPADATRRRWKAVIYLKT